MRAPTWISVSIGLAALAVSAAGCVYPHRGTSLSAVQRLDGAGSIAAPSDIWHFTVVGAQITPRKRGDLAWDDGGLPDAFVRVYRDEALIFETPTLDDTLTPEWNASAERNVRLGSEHALRIEVWDRDTIGADPIGIFRSRGLPQNAIPDASARLLLENGSYVSIRISAPRPHRGVGIAEYEVRSDALTVVRVLPFSPAARADIVPGDRIVAIGDRRVSAMTDAEASSALSMAAHRTTEITVANARGTERTIRLDRNFVWLTI
jgi:membrane-associated protease RseP (regulator of RpoE activity)